VLCGIKARLRRASGLDGVLARLAPATASGGASLTLLQTAPNVGRVDPVEIWGTRFTPPAQVFLAPRERHTANGKRRLASSMRSVAIGSPRPASRPVAQPEHLNDHIADLVRGPDHHGRADCAGRDATASAFGSQDGGQIDGPELGGVVGSVSQQHDAGGLRGRG